MPILPAVVTRAFSLPLRGMVKSSLCAMPVSARSGTQRAHPCRRRGRSRPDHLPPRPNRVRSSGRACGGERLLLHMFASSPHPPPLLTWTGLERAVVLLSPTCPLVLLPQHQSVSSLLI